MFFNQKAYSISESALRAVSKMGEKAALYPYLTTLADLRADRKMRGFEWRNISSSDVYACGLYSDYQCSNKLKEDFIQALFVMYRRIHRIDAHARSDKQMRILFNEVYDRVITKNQGNMPIGDVFKKELVETLFAGARVNQDRFQDYIESINTFLWTALTLLWTIASGLFLISLVIAVLPELCLLSLCAMVATLALMIVPLVLILFATMAHAFAKWISVPDFTAVLPQNVSSPEPLESIVPSAPPANDDFIEMNGLLYPVAHAVAV